MFFSVCELNLNLKNGLVKKKKSKLYNRKIQKQTQLQIWWWFSPQVVSDPYDPMECSPTKSPLSMGFSRQEYCSGLPSPSPGDRPNPGIEPQSPALQAEPLPTEPPGKPRNPYLKGQQQCGPYELSKKQTKVSFQDKSPLWEYNAEQGRDSKGNSQIQIKLWAGNEGGGSPEYKLYFVSLCREKGKREIQSLEKKF